MVRIIHKIAFISLLMGFLVLLEQYMVYRVWFQIGDIHHETFAIAFFSLSLGILLGLVDRTRRKT